MIVSSVVPGCPQRILKHIVPLVVAHDMTNYVLFEVVPSTLFQKLVRQFSVRRIASNKTSYTWMVGGGYGFVDRVTELL